MAEIHAVVGIVSSPNRSQRGPSSSVYCRQPKKKRHQYDAGIVSTAQ